MLNPAKLYSLPFTSDGIATSMSFDMSLTPINENFRGNLPNALILGQVKDPGGNVLSGVTFNLAGTTITISFNVAPPQLYNGSTALYTASWYLQFPN